MGSLRRRVGVLLAGAGAALVLAACSSSTNGVGSAPTHRSPSSAPSTSASSSPPASSSTPPPSSAPASSSAPPASSSSASPSPAAQTAAVYFGRCYSPGAVLQIEPSQAPFGCDGTGTLLHMRWTSWTLTGANGTGTAQLRGCTPNCAQGQDYTYPVVVHLSGGRPVPALAACTEDARFYTTLIVAFPDGYPKAVFGGPAPTSYRGMAAQSYPALPLTRC